ncbi:hypothetical protein [Frigoribacterium sp. PhB24]|uniref:hypothetical protein n=1 Tax=Frigoribacterium sp. PhB24 TaxID=2485204 RepID=UPI000F47049A|nr:hypothetical protein [Frigoribacterium sp. PhB24]ROS52921.1 hypothetical protein EDF50_1397 [Frigoribacterium sp. PhB24]
MLPISDEARKALEDNHTPSYRARAFYGADLTVDDVPLDVDGSLSFSGDATPSATGSVYVRKQDGRSLVPRTDTDPLAPTGQEISIARVVRVGQTEWEIPMGRYRIEEVPDMREYFRLFPSMKEVVGWECQLKLVDRFDIIDADDFLVPESPKPGNSTWAEIQRLSPLPIVRSLPDRSVPPSLAYKSRLEAIEDLMSNIGGIPHLTREGTLTARKKDAWLTETVPVFTIDGVIDVGGGMSNKRYNAVSVRSSTGSNDIVSVREINDPSNPLSVTGPLRRRTYKHSSPLIERQAQADAESTTILRRVSSKQSRSITFSCLPRPDIEVGDFGKVIDRNARRVFLGEVSDMRFSMDPNADMTGTMIVSEELSYEAEADQ